ncbi:tRNA 2-thiocytidine biosynthesis protein TtcA [Erysipelothrix larvae]|uniref:tRNA 2-thiocytidine biosynthesis protein TtcA n=1 Tax=Erysipelothrix larvae TaxID=1514105 RepID=A0A0X8H1C1_9FIRM|nr:ATP-binding protein [Erysipelothrix larvae]AMC94256.1 tRNA 2-thiocytidine biosynthesis protein TtcA [Erysipelothrix larvae]
MNHEMRNSVLKTYRKELWSRFMRAITDYDLIQPNDRIAICISGGKDSMLMALMFKVLQTFSEVPFEVKYVVMDPGYKKEHRQQIIDNAQKLDIPIEIHDSRIFEYVDTLPKSPCYLCARMRRGHLYAFAEKLGCNKIALGHHYDDAIETTLLNIFYGGQFGTMLPRLNSTSNQGMELIRPLYLVREKSIIKWATRYNLEFLNCACSFTEKKQTDSKRLEIKKLIETLSETNPFLEANIFRSVEHVNLGKVMSYYDDDIEEVSFLDQFKKDNT